MRQSAYQLVAFDCAQAQVFYLQAVFRFNPGQRNIHLAICEASAQINDGIVECDPLALVYGQRPCQLQWHLSRLTLSQHAHR